MRKLSRIYGVSRRVEMKKTIDRVMIAGGSRIGLHLARIMDEKNLSVVLIEEDGSVCEDLAEKLPGVLVIEGSPADKVVLKDEGVSEADAFLAVTDREEVNILTSLIASQLGAGKSIALVDRPGLKSSLEELGIDLVISPRSVTLSTVLKYFHQEDFDSLAILNQGEAQVIQIKVKEKSKGANSRLDSIAGLRTKDIVVGAIIREKSLIIPRGDTFLHPGDKLIVVTRSKHLKWVKDHFTR
jgi:trk system potassium uptake protein TrkA